MEKKTNQARILLQRTTYFLSSVLVVLSLVPSALESQQLGSAIITYQESITTDEEDRNLVLPSFIYADLLTGEVYVIDGKGRIIIFSPELFPLITLGKRDGVEAPQGLTVDAEGNLYIAQAASKSNPKNRISVYNACLKWERDIYLEDFEGSGSFAPYRLAIDKKGNLYVAASHFPGVVYVDTTGRFIDIIAPEEDGKKIKLNSVVIDKAGKIYVVSEDQSHIYVYDENRKFINKFGEKGGSTGKLSRPKAIGVDDRTGRSFVVDYMRHTVTSYDKEGKYLFEFGGLGWSEGWFQHPVNLAIDNKGRIFVADLFNQRVQVFNSW
jgi:DNA-binding beta-propeller fold protein YncE